MRAPTIHLLGYASGIAGINQGNSSEGPFTIQRSSYLTALVKDNILQWEKIFTLNEGKTLSKAEQVKQHCTHLANQIHALTIHQTFFIVIGGDHSSAIGTWSGTSHALRHHGPIGLIWIDAHMDSHTPDTSPSGNIHGMPLACLLGYGMPSLTSILDNQAKIQPEHLCLIGVRNFEPEEAALLEKLNIKVFFMKEIEERGLNAVMKDALNIVTKNTAGFGISIDIDSIDPQDAPGTGVPEPNGIHASDLCRELQKIATTPNLIGIEIAEFNPYYDKNNKTEKLIASLIEIFTHRGILS